MLFNGETDLKFRFVTISSLSKLCLYPTDGWKRRPSSGQTRFTVLSQLRHNGRQFFDL